MLTMEGELVIKIMSENVTERLEAIQFSRCWVGKQRLRIFNLLHNFALLETFYVKKQFP